MTLIELLAVLSVFSGFAAGAAIGGEHGILGAAAGATIGAIVLPTAFAIAIAAIAWPFDRLAERRRRERLRPCFGEFWGSARDASWSATRARLLPGERVRGRVVARHQGEVFLDVECGFPAKLCWLHMSPPDGDHVSVRPVFPDVGEVLDAYVLETNERRRELVLTQKPTEWLLFGGVPIGYLFRSPNEPGVRRELYHAFLGPAHTAFAFRCKLAGSAPLEVSDGSTRTPVVARPCASWMLELTPRA